MAIIFPHTGKAVNGDTKTPAGSRLDYFTRAKENRSSSASITVIGDTVNSYKSRITREIADVDTTSMQSMTVESYLDYISDVRLTTLPHRGSLWDKVLRWAEFFGLQITSYAAVTDSFATGSEEAARHILTFSRSLLMACIPNNSHGNSKGPHTDFDIARSRKRSRTRANIQCFPPSGIVTCFPSSSQITAHTRPID